MTIDKLQSAFAKLERANHHLKHLNEIIETDQRNKVFGIKFKHKTATNEIVMLALISAEPLIRYSLIAGEAIGQTRSALEHAIWGILPNPNRTSGFPVFRQIQDYEGRKGSMIENINPAVEAIIRSVQPFEKDYQKNPLYILHELWNIDKHRFLNTCVSYPQGVQLIYVYPNGAFKTKHIAVPNDIKDNDEFFREAHPGVGVKIDAEVAISSVRFYEGIVKGQAVTELLHQLIGFAKNIIDKLVITTK